MAACIGQPVSPAGREGASVSGPAVRAMVRRLIDAEPAGKPLADEAIAGLEQ